MIEEDDLDPWSPHAPPNLGKERTEKKMKWGGGGGDGNQEKNEKNLYRQPRILFSTSMNAKSCIALPHLLNSLESQLFW